MNFHNIRTSILNNDLVDQYPYFISEIKQKKLNHSRIKTKDFSLISIIKILECLYDGEKSFSNFYLLSGIGMKRSFLNYINLCSYFNLIEKERLGVYMYYRLKEKGKILLDLFRNDSS